MMWPFINGLVEFKMLLRYLGLLVFFTCVSRGLSNQDLGLKHENEVFVLSDKNFHHLVTSHEIVLVLFHVPWDPQYRNIIPQIEKVAWKLEQEAPSVLIGRLDVSLYPAIAEELDIRGDNVQFLFYHHGKPYNWPNILNTDQLFAKLVETSRTIWNPPRARPELVTELTEHEFDKTLQRLDFASVLFYREECPSCVRYLVEYETALVNLTVTDKVRYFKVNLDQAKGLSEQLEITSVPSLKIFRNGKKFDFESYPKIALELVQFLKKQQIPGHREFNTLEEATGWARSHPNKAAVVATFEANDNEIYEPFVDAANLLRDDINFARVKGKSETGNWQVTSYPPRRHTSPEDKPQQIYQGKPYLESLVKFVNQSTVPLVGQRTTKNKDSVYGFRPLLVCYFNISWTKDALTDTEYHRNKFAQVAVGFKDKIRFAISDRKEFKSELVRFGLDKYSEEVLLGIIGKNGEYYPGPVEDVVNLKHLTDFSHQYLANSLKPFHRTQSPPTSDDSDEDDYAVKVVVGATFRKLILRHDKQTLLFAHRPNCPACKKGLTVFNDIAESKEYPNAMFASMDMLSNDPPARFASKSFPALLYIPADKKQHPIRYPWKDFNKDKMKKFIDEHYSSVRYKTDL